jgi:hypothetical protein
MQNMKTHWVADLYPLNMDDVAALADDIRQTAKSRQSRRLKMAALLTGATAGWRVSALAWNR